jgi:hypothetical protein
MKQQDKVKIDAVEFQIVEKHLQVSAPCSNFETDGDLKRLSIPFDADKVRELMTLLSNAIAQPFNARQTFRIPLKSALGKAIDVTGKIVDGDKEIEVTPTSISMTGVFITSPNGLERPYEVGDQFIFQVQFEDHAASLNCTVKRVNEDGIGCFFNDSIKNEELDPPDNLVQMIVDIQRTWIKSKMP